MKSFHYNQDPIYSLAASILQGELTEKINYLLDYLPTSEKSKFGGFRPKVVHKTKKGFLYLGQASYNTADEAKDHAEDYLKQLDKFPHRTPNVPVRGTYEEIEETLSKMGTATITKPGHFMDGKQVDIFRKFPDGRINAQYRTNDSKGKMVHNMTLKPNEYELDEELEESRVIPSRATVKKAYNLVTDFEAEDMEQFLFVMASYFKGEGKDFVKTAGHALKAAQTFKGESRNIEESLERLPSHSQIADQINKFVSLNLNTKFTHNREGLDDLISDLIQYRKTLADPKEYMKLNLL